MAEWDLQTHPKDNANYNITDNNVATIKKSYNKLDIDKNPLQLSNIRGPSNSSIFDYFASDFDDDNYSKQLDYAIGSSKTIGNVQNYSLVVLQPPTFNEMALIKTVCLSVIFVISLIGNSATLIQMYRMRRRKSTINTLIMHLATADLLVTFFCNVTDAVWASTIQWYAGNLMCKVLKFLQVFGLYFSTYIIVIIAIDRCMAILDPMSRNTAPQRVRLMILGAWFLSAVFSLPQLYIFRVARGPFEEEFYQCVTYGAYTAAWQEPLYSCLSVILMFIMPLVIMVIAYMLIFCTIAKKSRDLQREESEVEASSQEMLSRGPVRGQLFRKAKVKSLRMTALIVFAFISLWTPYYIVFIKYVFTQKADDKVAMWFFFCVMTNSMVNPMIYGAFHVCARRRTKQPRQIKFRQRTQSASPSSHRTHSHSTDPSSSATNNNSRCSHPVIIDPLSCSAYCESRMVDKWTREGEN